MPTEQERARHRLCVSAHTPPTLLYPLRTAGAAGDTGVPTLMPLLLPRIFKWTVSHIVLVVRQAYNGPVGRGSTSTRTSTPRIPQCPLIPNGRDTYITPRPLRRLCGLCARRSRSRSRRALLGYERIAVRRCTMALSASPADAGGIGRSTARPGLQGTWRTCMEEEGCWCLGLPMLETPRLPRYSDKRKRGGGTGEG